MNKHRSFDRTKHTWRSREKGFLTANSWYQSNFHNVPALSMPKNNSISRGISSSGSIHKFRSRYLPPALTIKQNSVQQNQNVLTKSKSLVKLNTENIYSSQDKLLKIFYRRIHVDRGNLLQKQLTKLRQELPKANKLSEQKQLLVVEDFLKKMNFFREMKEDEMFKERLFSGLMNELDS